MFSTIISAGRCIYYITYIAYENKNTILHAYSLYDTSKFTFYVIERVGLVDYIKSKLKPEPSTVILVEKTENSELGDFEVIEVE
jgi:hypothetical protein